MGDGLNVEAALPQQERDDIEADSFWCLTKILDGLQDKVKEAKRKIELQERAMEDLAEKMEEVKD